MKISLSFALLIHFFYNLGFTVFYALAAPVIHWMRGHSFDADGVKIHYTDEGEGEAVVLVHGFAVTGDINWRYPGITRTLKKHFRVLTLDDRGHGRTGKPSDPAQYGIEMVRDVVRLLDHLGIEKAHVAGYSMGGFITLKLLMEHPDRLRSAAICAAGWDTLDSENMQLIQSISESLLAGEGFDPLLIKLDPGSKAPSSLKLKFTNLVLRCIVNPHVMGLVMKNFSELVIEEEELRKNTVPAISIVGQDDPLAELEANLEGRLENHHGVRLPCADHLTTILYPEYMETLLNFFLENRGK